MTEVNKVKHGFCPTRLKTWLKIQLDSQGQSQGESATSLSRCPCEARCGADWRRAA
jgi:hypothetical protein